MKICAFFRFLNMWDFKNVANVKKDRVIIRAVPPDLSTIHIYILNRIWRIKQKKPSIETQMAVKRTLSFNVQYFHSYFFSDPVIKSGDYKHQFFRGVF